MYIATADTKIVDTHESWSSRKSESIFGHHLLLCSYTFSGCLLPKQSDDDDDDDDDVL